MRLSQFTAAALSTMFAPNGNLMHLHSVQSNYLVRKKYLYVRHLTLCKIILCRVVLSAPCRRGHGPILLKIMRIPPMLLRFILVAERRYSIARRTGGGSSRSRLSSCTSLTRMSFRLSRTT